MKDPIRRFMAMVLKSTDGCWIWQGCRDRKHGYGHFTVAGKRIGAHRFAFFCVAGKTTDKPELHHICENEGCVNPDHLLPVTRKEHTHLTPDNLSCKNAMKTHCPNGHPFDQSNTHHSPAGRRVCRACKRIKAMKEYYARKEAGLPTRKAQRKQAEIALEMWQRKARMEATQRLLDGAREAVR